MEHTFETYAKCALYISPYILKMLWLWLYELVYFCTPFNSWPFKVPVNDKLVLLTGAAGGLGQILAEKFAEKNCRLVLWDMNQKALEALKERLVSKYKVTIDVKVVDITNDEDVAASCEEVKKKIGLPDILFNNAGILGYHKEFIFPMKVYDSVLKINSRAPVLIIRNFLEDFIARNSGYIVTTGSFSGHIAVGVVNPYVTSKHCIVGFMGTLRHFLKTRGKNIKCLTICPNYIKTPMVAGAEYDNPLMPMLEADYVADRLIEAIECQREDMFLPKFTWIFVLLKGIMPTSVFDTFLEMFALHGSVNT